MKVTAFGKSIALATLLMMSACAQDVRTQWSDAPQGMDSVAINADRPNGALEIPDIDIPDLGEARNLHKTHVRKRSDKQISADNAIKVHAQQYGLALGLSWATKRIDDDLNRQAGKLSAIYDFNSLLIADPSGHYILPPIITERDNSYELSDEGQTLKVADKTYTKEENETFTRNAPMWHQYLFRSYDRPAEPDNDALPSTIEEQDIWNRYVTEGFNKGVRQALDIFKDDVRRLNHDFTGMARYYELAEKGAISRPFVAKTDLGITGGNDKVNYNQRELSISGSAHLNYDRPEKITAHPSTETPTEAIQTPSLSDAAQ